MKPKTVLYQQMVICYSLSVLGGRLTVGLRPLEAAMKVRILPPQLGIAGLIH